MYDERDCLNFLIAYYQKQVSIGNLNNFYYPISPLYVGLKITEKCNQNCKHCWAGKNNVEKSTKEIIYAIEKLSQYKIMHLTLTGGEPLIRSDFISILNKAIELFPIVEVFSNGLSLNESLVKEIKQSFRKTDYFQISLDGLHHNYQIQRGIDSFDIVVKNIKLLIKYDINVRIHMTVTEFNICDVISIYYLAIKLNAKVFSVTPVYELRRGEHLKSQNLLNEYERIINKLKLIHSKNNPDILLRIFMPLEIKSKYAHTCSTLSNSNYQFFNDNILHWTIDASGNIYNFIDHYFYEDLYIGNIYSDSLEDINKRNLLVQQKIGIRNLANCKCSHCSNIQRCKGGNYINIFPNIDEADERCVFNE